MTRSGARFGAASGLAALLLGGAGCEALLGSPVAAPARISLADVPRLAGSWRGIWRNTRGVEGSLVVSIAPSPTRERVIGTVHFAGGACPRVTPLEGGMIEGRLVVTGDLGPPCGLATLTFVESRSEVPRLTGSFTTDYPEHGLFAVYPR